MNETTNEPDGVPEDYPGRIVRFPDGSTALVVCLLGVQGSDEHARRRFIDQCIALAKPSNPTLRHVSKAASASIAQAWQRIY